MNKQIDPGEFKPPIGVETLDGLGCPGCGHTHEHGPMELKAKCHPDAGTHCAYQHGVLYIVCKRCDKPVTAVIVGTEPGILTRS